MPAFVSTHGLPLRDHYLATRLAPKRTDWSVLLLLPPLLPSLFWIHSASDCSYRGSVEKLPVSPNLPTSAFLQHFPPLQGARGAERRGGERKGGDCCHTPVMKKGWPFGDSRQNAGVIQISSVGAAQLSPCPVNPLGASHWQAKKQRRSLEGYVNGSIQQMCPFRLHIVIQHL